MVKFGRIFAEITSNMSKEETIAKLVYSKIEEQLQQENMFLTKWKMYFSSKAIALYLP